MMIEQREANVCEILDGGHIILITPCEQGTTNTPMCTTTTTYIYSFESNCPLHKVLIEFASNGRTPICLQ